MPANVNLTTEQKVKVTLAPVTANGSPATLDGEPEWTVESGDCTVNPEEGGLSAYIVSGETIGESIIKVAADADLGEGERHIEDLVTVNVTNAEAAALGVTVGAPEAKTEDDVPHVDNTLPGDLGRKSGAKPGAKSGQKKK
jgi:hypothetical protein